MGLPGADHTRPESKETGTYTKYCCLQQNRLRIWHSGQSGLAWAYTALAMKSEMVGSGTSIPKHTCLSLNGKADIVADDRWIWQEGHDIWHKRNLQAGDGRDVRLVDH
jgi:hypothetical protein